MSISGWLLGHQLEVDTCPRNLQKAADRFASCSEERMREGDAFPLGGQLQRRRGGGSCRFCFWGITRERKNQRVRVFGRENRKTKFEGERGIFPLIERKVEREPERESGPRGLLVGVFWQRVEEPESLEEVGVFLAGFGLVIE